MNQLRAVKTEKSIDHLPKDEIIGRDACEKQTRSIPVFEDASKRDVKYGRLGEILRGLKK